MIKLNFFVMGLTSITILMALLSEGRSNSPQGEQDTPVTIREAIIKAYMRWGKARVEIDKDTLRSMLTEDFKVTINGTDYNTEQFMGMVGDPDDKNSHMKRFDVTVLSVQKAGNDWSAVIEEKIEYEVKGSDGKWITIYSLWVTRDGFTRTSEGIKFKSSEAIGWEHWRDQKPPFNDW